MFLTLKILPFFPSLKKSILKTKEEHEYLIHISLGGDSEVFKLGATVLYFSGPSVLGLKSLILFNKVGFQQVRFRIFCIMRFKDFSLNK
jgi:hypothetical protein